jgi:hypothetical protein
MGRLDIDGKCTIQPGGDLGGSGEHDAYGITLSGNDCYAMYPEIEYTT